MKKLSRQEILDGVERLRPWFHLIELGDGIRTKEGSVAREDADHPLGVWQIISQCLPADLTGRSVLDVGCNAGFYSVRAYERGAARVLGVDAQRHQIQQALFVRRALRMEIEFQRMSVYDLDPHTMGQFDVTLALGLVYHCKHLVAALERLYLVTKELLILETAILPPGATRRAAQVGAEADEPFYLLGYVENPPELKEAVYNWFLPSPEALRALLLNVGFPEVTLFHVTDDRAVFVCRKTEAFPDSHALPYLAAALEMEEAPERGHASEVLTFHVRATNTGFARWLAEGRDGTKRGAVLLTVHLLNAEEEQLDEYFAGAFLPHEIRPGESVSLELRLRAPAAPGTYLLEFDMVSEHLAWFSDLGSATLRHRLGVE